MKLEAWAGFTLPGFDRVAEGVTAVARNPLTLSAVYYDTVDLRLMRWGVTLRHRSGDGDGDGAEWTLKLPDGDGGDGPELVRRELTFDAPAGPVPAAAAAVVMSYTRGEALLAVAQLRTVRTGVDLMDQEGTKLAEVVEDEVSVLHRGRVGTRFREIEVELAPGVDNTFLAAVVDSLQTAGAGKPDSMPKVVRALGARALEPPDVIPVVLGARPSAAEALRATISAAVLALLRHDPGVRVGEDPEDVRRARVAVRRLRSDLRTFGPLLDADRVDPMRDELRWLVGMLGAVRDIDMLQERFYRQGADLAGSGTTGLDPLFRQLIAGRDEAQAGLMAAMASPRYLKLIDGLVGVALRPPCSPSASGQAATVLPSFVSRQWKQLRRCVRNLPPSPAPAGLHRVLVRAERARYASDASVAVVGRKAESLTQALADLQTVLGDHRDALVAEAWLRRCDVSGPHLTSTVSGLIAMQQAEAQGCGGQWRVAWRRAAAKPHRSWL